MSRSRRLANALASGFGSTLVNAVCTLVSIPIALEYLPFEEFSLWSLTTQIVSYLILVDAAISGSLSRILVDHWVSNDETRYRNALVTVKTVTLAQGVFAGGIAIAVGLAVPLFMAIPPAYTDTFRILLLGQGIWFGAGLALKWMNHVLVAHQRYDIINHSQTVGTLVGLGALFYGLKSGFGVYSVLISTTLAGAVSTIWVYVAGRRCGALPTVKIDGKFDRQMFREMSSFGGKLFLQVLGWQLLSASQLIVLTQVAGLGMAGIYSTCIKTFMVVQQLVYRVFDSSVAGLSEMASKGDMPRMRQRVLDLAVISGVLAAIGAILTASCNGAFVQWWTKGRVAWEPLNDWLLGGLMFAYAVNRIHGGVAWIIKDTSRIQHVYPLEGLVVIFAGALAVTKSGPAGLLIVSIAASFAFSGCLGARSTSQALHIPMRQLLSATWGRPVAAFICFFAIAFSCWRYFLPLTPWPRMLTLSGILVPVGVAIAALALPPRLRSEISGFFQRRRVRSKRGN